MPNPTEYLERYLLACQAGDHDAADEALAWLTTWGRTGGELPDVRPYVADLAAN